MNSTPSPLLRERILWQVIVFGLAAATALSGAIAILVRVALVVPAGWAGVAIFAIGGGALAVMALRKHAVAQCPSCAGSRLVFEHADERSRAMCKQCHAWAEISGGCVIPLALDTVDPRHGFAFDIIRGMELPPLCAACGVPATRAFPLSSKNHNLGMTAATVLGGLASGNLAIAFASTGASAHIPHCDAHQGGAVMKEHQSAPALAVMSYRFYRAVAERSPVFRSIARVRSH